MVTIMECYFHRLLSGLCEYLTLTMSVQSGRTESERYVWCLNGEYYQSSTIPTTEYDDRLILSFRLSIFRCLLLFSQGPQTLNA